MIHITSLPAAGSATVRPVPRTAGGGLPQRLDTVLIIEDDATTRLALACMVADTHRQIVLARSADDALAHLGLVDPDVILCDFLLDGVSGREFCRRMKAMRRWRGVPIIMVTRMDARSIITDLLLSGADDVLVKPVRAAQLRARVLRALHARAHHPDPAGTLGEPAGSLVSAIV